MITGAALIVISRCLVGFPTAATAVLVLGIIKIAFGFLNSLIGIIRK